MMKKPTSSCINSGSDVIKLSGVEADRDARIRLAWVWMSACSGDWY